METYTIFKDLAIIIVFAKIFGIIARRLQAPQVVGEIIAGLLIGPAVLGLVQQNDFLLRMAEIGVVLIMFQAGIETNIKELLKTGPIAFVIACAGVVIPLIGGTVLFLFYYGIEKFGSDTFFTAVFIGCILSATSVSITVQTLKEMGKLKGQVGTTILSAAIIDDIIGIMLLTFVIGFKDPQTKPATVVIQTIGFILFAIIVGYIVYVIFNKIDKKYPHTRRIPILSLALCLGLSYIAEHYFGVADITGAYVAGIILCSISDSEYIARKMDINSYMIFGPVFFASIGLKTNIGQITTGVLIFSILFVIVGLITKIIGCGITAKLCGFSKVDSLKIGIGMMTRGEVALIIAQKGLTATIISPIYFTSVILLIVLSSIITPIALKYIYTKETYGRFQ